MPSPFTWGSAGPKSLQAGGVTLTDLHYLKNDGDKNYLTNPLFETNVTTGWGLGTVTLTSSLPTGTPTFGSGASGNLTLTSTSSSPLAGAYSLSYASSAATTAGNFVASDAFTIDIADQAKVLTFGFYYQASSGTTNVNWSGTTSNSFAVAIYNVTQGAANWIVPAGVFNITQSSGVGYCTGTFQTTSSDTQYRIVVYNANATGGAATMLFDRFYLGPQTSPQGCPVSAATAYTPTVVGFGTLASSTYTWSRIGDSVLIEGTMVTGTNTATEARVPLPTGLTSASDYPTIQLVGYGTTSTSDQSFLPLIEASKTYLTFGKANSAVAGITKQNGSAWANAGTLSFKAVVRIAGWSANVSMSADTDTRVIEAVCTTAAGQSITNATISIVNFGTVVSDSSGAVTTGASWKFTAPVTGYYQVNAQILYASQSWSSGVAFDLYLYKNGALYARIFDYTITGTPTAVMPSGGSQLVQLNAGDFIDVRTNQSSAGAKALTSVATDNVISVFRLSGPSVIAATETVAAAYTDTAGSALGNNAFATYTFATKVTDSHNAYSGGTYTIPVSGRYQVSAMIRTASTTISGTNSIQVSINQNGTLKILGSTSGSGAATIFATQAYGLLNCVAGDTITIQTKNTTGAVNADTTAGAMYFSIDRIGF